MLFFSVAPFLGERFWQFPYCLPLKQPRLRYPEEHTLRRTWTQNNIHVWKILTSGNCVVNGFPLVVGTSPIAALK